MIETTALQTGVERQLLTPEGVRLPVRIATFWERVAAATCDAVVIFLPVLFLGLAATVIGADQKTAAAIIGAVAFVARCIYFPYFELQWDGRTPGKKWTGIRVVGRDGAPLDGQMTLARNMMREAEMWMPLTYVVIHGSGDPYLYVAGLLWVIGFTAIPLLNKECMRGGDLIAGTWVIQDQRRELVQDLMSDRRPIDVAAPDPGPMPAPETKSTAEAETSIEDPDTASQSDLATTAEAAEQETSADQTADGAEPEGEQPANAPAHETPAAEADGDATAEIRFTDAQLDAYGEAELEVLASVLRETGPHTGQKLEIIARTIKRKIAFDGDDGDREFLDAYYRSFRLKLERDAQWGRRRRDKHDR